MVVVEIVDFCVDHSDNFCQKLQHLYKLKRSYEKFTNLIEASSFRMLFFRQVFVLDSSSYHCYDLIYLVYRMHSTVTSHPTTSGWRPETSLPINLSPWMSRYSHPPPLTQRCRQSGLHFHLQSQIRDGAVPQAGTAVVFLFRPNNMYQAGKDYGEKWVCEYYRSVLFTFLLFLVPWFIHWISWIYIVYFISVFLTYGVLY